MRIPDAKIDEVRSASDIVDVISAYVNLKKRGKNYLGLCPFHREKTPSFTVSAEKQMYHCFGCGVGGNVFTFVMEHDKVSFIEAVRSLAERTGIALPAERPEDRAQATETEALYTICRDAARYFHENLVSTVEGKLALEYFHHRGFSEETINLFGLGYAMNSWDGLVRFAEREAIDLALLEKAGLVVKREDPSGRDSPAGVYDRFRARAMFPILSASGRTIGFGARKMREEDPLGKYINSPETPIYNKSRNLYGLFQAKEAIRGNGSSILVEGYADLLSVYQAGIHNVVASSGTALTEEQILLLGRYARNVTLVYDGDSAGSKATIRGADLIIERGFEVRVAELPEGEDPDSFVRKEGGPAFQKLLDDAIPYLDFKWKSFQSQGLLNTPDGKTRAVRSIVETIGKMKDELKRNFYIKSVSERYGIYESVLFRELDAVLGREQRRFRGSEEPGQPPAGGQTEEKPRPAGTPLPAPERDLLKVMLETGADMVQFVTASLESETLDDPRAQKILRVIQDNPRHLGGNDLTALFDQIQDEELSRIVADIVFNKYEISKGWSRLDEPDPREIAEACIFRIRSLALDRLVADQYAQMKEAGARGESVLQFQQQIQSLQQKKKELQSARPVNRPADS